MNIVIDPYLLCGKVRAIVSTSQRTIINTDIDTAVLIATGYLFAMEDMKNEAQDD